jgi:adenosylcobinamide kinase/adenosylcobinamide-phosphate guanylyltransferase
MMILVTGGSKSGKSSLAERFFDGFPGERYYLATMQPFGADARAAIERHRAMRAGKGFLTVERCTDLAGLDLPRGCGVLLECMGNLCANEMFREDGIYDPVSPVLRGIAHIRETADLFVIVTNEVGADGIAYPPETMQYIRCLAEINRKTAAFADTVIECTAGIPNVLKGAYPC